MSRGKRLDFSNGEKIQIAMYIVGSVLAIFIIAVVLVIMFSGKDNKADMSVIEFGQANTVVPNINDNYAKIVSSSDDKTVEESKKNTIKIETTDKKEEQLIETTTEEKLENTVINEQKINEENEESIHTSNNEIIDEDLELGSIEINDKNNDKSNTNSFVAPVSGEIIRDYAEETLVYSDTLDEWTTHLGIDIEAKKTSVVIASADGFVESKKNDPRYGLTVIISHDNGMKTIYSNLLTAEYVSEGDEVKQGQTIGTVGNSATFEILDPSHLHFEMIKDGKNVNPTLYLK